MMSLDYHIKQYLPELIREDRWTILTALILDSNADNRCWPSGKRIHNVTGKSQTTITKAKQWLIKHGAIELIPNAERTEREKVLPRRQHVYKLTGILDFNGEKVPYFFQSQSNPTNMEVPQSGNSTTLKFHPVETKYCTEELDSSEVNTINTDIPKGISPIDAGQSDPTQQSYHMVSNHIDDSDKMVAPLKGKKSQPPKVAKKGIPPPSTEVKNAFAVYCYRNVNAWSTSGSLLSKSLNTIAKAEGRPITVEDLRGHYAWWKKNDWRGKKGEMPKPYQVSETWASYQASLDPDAPSLDYPDDDDGWGGIPVARAGMSMPIAIPRNEGR